MTGIAAGRVSPFGHLGITACVPLPRAYRSLPRPSSPPCAQASPTCLRSLDYKSPVKQSYAHDVAIYFTYQFPSAYRCTTRATVRQHHERTMSIDQDSISHESIVDQKTKSIDPSSVLHFSNSVRDRRTLAVSLAILAELELDCQAGVRRLTLSHANDPRTRERVRIEESHENEYKRLICASGAMR